MSGHDHHAAIDLYEQRGNFFLKPSATLQGAIATGVVIGAMSFFAGMWTGQATRTWGSLLFNTFFFFCIALGGIVFTGMQDVVGAQWARPIKRIHESFAAFLPVAAFFLIVFFICIRFGIGHADHVYHWISDPSVVAEKFGKNVWLERDFMLIRDFIAIALVLYLSRWQLRHSLTRDILFINGDRAGAEKVGLASLETTRYWSAPVLILYALCFSLLSFDMNMALAPHWMSTLFAGWQFAIMMQTLFAFLLLMLFALRNTPLGQVYKQQQFHDVGKLMHGFTIFFAYLTYAHILTYWYGNMPEETEYYIERLHAPWIYFVYVIPILGFVLPLYTLLIKKSKWTAGFAVPLALLILFAQWLTNLIVVMPQVVHEPEHYFPWIEAGMFCGFLALFVGSIFRFGRKYPMLALADPLLKKALAGGH